MTPSAFLDEGGILAIRLQVNVPPTGPTPAISTPELHRVFYHHLDLPELRWNNEPCGGLLLLPGDFSKPCSVWPRMNISLPSRPSCPRTPQESAKTTGEGNL